MRLSEKIITSLFIDEEIEQLKTIYSCMSLEYMESIELDPYSHDYTDEELEKRIKLILERKFDDKISDEDIKRIYNLIKFEII